MKNNNNNNKENYVVLNGVKVELSDELVQQLQEGIKESLFKDEEDERVEVKKKVNKVEDLFKRGDMYTYVGFDGNTITYQSETGHEIDTKMYNNINYFPQIGGFDSNLLAEYFHKKNLMQRKMMKFSLLHDGYKINWDNVNSAKYYIQIRENKTEVQTSYTIYKYNQVYFHSKEIAQQFIDENETGLLKLLELEKQLFKSVADYCED